MEAITSDKPTWEGGGYTYANDDATVQHSPQPRQRYTKPPLVEPAVLYAMFAKVFFPGAKLLWKAVPKVEREKWTILSNNLSRVVEENLNDRI